MKHLTLSQRIELQALKKAGHSQQFIADMIGTSQPTVSRELKRNSSDKQNRYNANTAQKRSDERKQASYATRDRWYDNEHYLQHVIEELRDGKSPEQVTGRRRLLGKETVSHTTIYTYIEQNKQQGGVLYKYLRYQGKKFKWRGVLSEKTRIVNRKDIAERPEIVNNKERLGDWESDLVVSPRGKLGAVATFAERKSLYFQAIVVQNQSATEMVRATSAALGSLPRQARHTMTHDNGKEICFHEQITKTLEIDVYCARPYKSCDRGLNEWYNRELRRFFPKGTDFSKVSQKEIDQAVHWLNNCPRKSLDYRTPKEVFEEELAIMHFTV